MKVLSNTSVYKYAELLGGIKLSSSIRGIIDEKLGAIYITESQLDDVFYKIRHKSFNFKAKFGVIDLFRKGIIRLVYNPKVKLTVAVPFFAYKMPTGGLGVVVNISNYASIESDGSVKIDPLVLYTLMIAASYSLQVEQTAPILASNGLPELYADLFVNVIVRMSNLDLARRDKIKYLICKYMYIELGENEKRASEYAAKSIRYLDAYTIEQLNMMLPEKSFENLETLINSMRETMIEMNGITFGMIFDKWMKAYGESTGFAIEYLPYFIYQFIALITNCNGIVNVKAIESIANKDSKRLVTLYDRIEIAVQTFSQR